MTAKQATINNSAGIHVRPSGEIYQGLKDYPGSIRLSAHGMSVSLSSVMGLIALGLQRGDTVEVEVDGPDDSAVCDHAVELLEKNFDFPPRN